DLGRPHARRVAPLVERDRAEPGGGERRQLPEPLPGVLREPVQQQHAPPGDRTGCEPVERAGASRDRDLRRHARGSRCHARTVSINEINLQSRLCRPEISTARLVLARTRGHDPRLERALHVFWPTHHAMTVGISSAYAAAPALPDIVQLSCHGTSTWS